jgi:hypothetical protein
VSERSEVGVEDEPRDEILGPFHESPDPEGAGLEPLPRPGSRVVLRLAAYGVAVAWPFVGTYYEYKTLNDSGTLSDICDEFGCVGLGTEFAHQALGWLVPLSLGSAFLVWGTDQAARAFARRRRAREPGVADDTPVNRIVLAAAFGGVLALAILLGVLRGLMIDSYGR